MSFGLNKNMIVLVIDPVTAIRTMIADVVKSFKFKETLAFEETRSALVYLEQETPGWIIMPPLAEDEYSCLTFLSTIVQNPRLRNTKVSLVVNADEEAYCLPASFELGLMSWHKRTKSQEEFSADLTELFSLLKVNNYDPTLVAAEYLRSYLDEKTYNLSRLAFERNLLELYPAMPNIMLSLAQAQFLNSLTEDGNQTLNQVILLNEKMAPQCKAIQDRFVNAASLPKTESEGGASPPQEKQEAPPKETQEAPKNEGQEEKTSSPTNLSSVFGVQTCVAIEPDSMVLQHVVELLKNTGVGDVHAFEKGKDAWEWVKANKEPDMIIMEWRIPEVTGPILIQRIRNRGYGMVPIVVISSLVKDNEVALLKEIGVDHVLRKPFDNRSFYKGIVQTIQRNRLPKDQVSLELRIRKLLRIGKVKEAYWLVRKFIEDPLIIPEAKLAIQAEYEYYKGHYKKAKELAIKAMRRGKETVYLMNLLGNCLMKLKMFDEALLFLDKAHEHCPLNIERVVNIADAEMQLDNFDKATEAVETAKSLDPEAEQVSEVEAKLAIETNDENTARKILDQLESNRKIVSYMNNRAIALARAGRFGDGIALYERTLKTLPEHDKQLKAVVSYNLGLAHARQGAKEESLAVLNLIKPEEEGLKKKVASLVKKIKGSIASGKAIHFSHDDAELVAKANEDDDTSFEVPKDDVLIQDYINNIDLQKGDLCLYLVFFFQEVHDERIKPMMERAKKRIVSKEKKVAA
ncbi:MAG: response regulator [Deltaproteobacteria bacterium]|nr:response regulator [Deltaproteobacteria bacterium]